MHQFIIFPTHFGLPNLVN